MFSTLLGLLTGLLVAAWGFRWYLEERTHERVIGAREIEDAQASVDGSPPPLVSLQEAERLMQASGENPPAATPQVMEESPAEVGEEARMPVRMAASVFTTTLETSERAADVVGGPEKHVPGEDTERETMAEGAGGSPPVDGLGAVQAAAKEEVYGHCTRCQERRVVQEPRRVRSGIGRPAVRGSCATCGAGMFVFISE